MIYKLDFDDKAILQKTIYILMKYDLFFDETSTADVSAHSSKMMTFKKFLSKKDIEDIEQCVESKLNALSDDKLIDFEDLRALDWRMLSPGQDDIGWKSYEEKLFLTKTFIAKLTASIDGRTVSMMLQMHCPTYAYEYILGTCMFAMKVR